MFPVIALHGRLIVNPVHLYNSIVLSALNYTKTTLLIYPGNSSKFSAIIFEDFGKRIRGEAVDDDFHFSWENGAYFMSLQ